MNDNQGQGATPPEDEEPRTVFTPGAAEPTPDERTIISPGAPATGPGHEDRTMISPSGGSAAPPPDERTMVAPAQPGMPQGQTSMPTFSNFAPRTDGRAIQIGDVLNHTYEVKRFLARGGMGEVFEGSNVMSEERVAIKVMLPALAADPNVISLFRKEAKTMTKLSHDALVKYRTLAQEPQLGVLYIVTEFIDGKNLADMLGKLTVDEKELTSLLRRLASGLAVAHSYGAVHRDISPDNVILEDGKLSRPKVIDFGIAKDLDPGSKTIVGEGFAGKLNYVAPEQLGDYNRNVGPWTDIYSLALVILAVCMGKNVQMGGSLFDAVEKRRSVPDVSCAPESLRPVLEAMLQPNPKDRPQSMEAVLAMLDPGIAAPPPAEPVKQGMSKGAIIAAAAAGLAILGAGAFFALNSGPSPEEQVQIARTAVDQALPGVECSWLNVADLRAGEPLSVRMTGVAGNPTTARNQISQAITGAGIEAANVSVDEVAIIRPEGCSALQTFGKVRSNAEPHMTVPQREFEMARQPAGAQYPVASVAKIALAPQQGKDLSLLGIEPNGELSELLPNRQALDEAVAAGLIKQSTPGRYELSIDMNHTGWSGLVLLTGDPPFDKAVTQPALNARGPDWQNNFVNAASERDWKSEMIWFKSVDKQPN
jgi:serine/threonine-protein kinase